MNTSELLLSHKYAQAFVNIFKEKLEYQDIERLYEWRNFFKTHDHLMFYLKLSTITDAVKITALIKTRSHYKLESSFDKLIKLLLESKRISLLPQVLKFISDAYEKYLNIIEFTFASAHELGDSEKDTFRKFLEAKVGKTIIAKAVVDKSLIAGVKLYSNELLWEYSIKKYIDSI